MNRSSTFTIAATLALSLATLSILPACSGTETIRKPRSRSANAATPLDVPPMMRGTVASTAVLDGYNDDVIVKGFGFVVGLRGTGGRILPDQIRSHMISEMARQGVGSATSNYRISPEELMNSKDTSVVVVTAVIPPGAPRGADFDVLVEALDQDTTSLEGGTLWTTELRPTGTADGLPPVGSRQARALAKANGPVFTNPFVEPGSSNASTQINGRTGRVLGGGRAVRDMPLKLRLVSPSHARASMLQQVVNSYFPQEPGQRYKTAHGEGDESIEITIPPSYHDDTWEFVNLLQHTPLRADSIDREIGYVAAALRESPGDATHASWRWQAFGTAALPSIREFYTYPEEKPRYAALRAGAALNDALVEPHLLDMASDESISNAIRKQSIELLGKMDPQPRVLLGLHELASDDAVDIRIAAYEALAQSNTRFIRTFYVDDQKYQIDFVDSTKPLIYVTLLEQPRVVVFGLETEFDMPLTFSTWSGKFLMKADNGDEKLEVAYLDASGTAVPYRISPRLHDFIPFLGHTTTIEKPQPGLGLTYSEVVGLLAAIHDADYLPAEFRTQQDQIRLTVLERTQNPVEFNVRPEFDDEPIGDFDGSGNAVNENTTFGDAQPENLLEEDIFAAPGSDGSDG